MKVIVMHEEIPEVAQKDQQDVLFQSRAVSEALSDLGHETVTLFFSLNLQKSIEDILNINPDIVFNLVEAVNGKGQFIYTAPLILDYLGLPYTGAKAEALFLTSNKLLAKKFLKSNGLPTPQWIELEDHKDKTILPSFSFNSNTPYVIKSVWEHASIGLDENSVIFAQDYHQIFDQMRAKVQEFSGEWFAEAYIDGREFNLSLLSGDTGVEILPPAEILFEDYPREKLKILGYRAKWMEETFEYKHTSRRYEISQKDTPLLNGLKKLALECHHIFNLRGYARVDFRVDQNNKPWIIDINANPCIAPDSGFTAAADRAGISFKDVVQRILNASLSPL